MSTPSYVQRLQKTHAIKNAKDVSRIGRSGYDTRRYGLVKPVEEVLILELYDDIHCVCKPVHPFRKTTTELQCFVSFKTAAALKFKKIYKFAYSFPRSVLSVF